MLGVPAARAPSPPARAPAALRAARATVHGLLATATLLLLPPTSPGTASAQAPGTPPGDTQPADPARDAYLDASARFLVLGVKAARDTAQLGIDAYTTLIRERMGVEAPTYQRDRPWVNGERVTRVRWSRDEPDVAHVLGARFRDPGQGPDDPPGYFSGLRTERFAADPRTDPFLFGLAALGASTDAAGRAILSPLAPGSERHYQFRSGDTISVELGGGRTITAVAVTAIPRVRSIRLVSAIMWIEPESMGLARIAYRLSKRLDREISWRLRQGGRWSVGFTVEDEYAFAAPDSAGVADPVAAPDSAAAPDPGHLPDSAAAPDSARTEPRRNSLFDRFLNGVVDNLIPQMAFDISTVVADYELYEFRHWLPRRVFWTGYWAVDEDPRASDRPPPPVPMTIDWSFEIEDVLERGAEAAPGAPATAAEALELWTQQDDSVSGDLAEAESGETITITPADRAALARSELLPPNQWEEGLAGLDADAVAEIASALAEIGTGEGGDRALAANPWTFHPPGRTLWLLRYNPVEGVSAGTRLRRDFGWGRGVVTVRIPTRRVQAPDADLTLVRDSPGRRIQFSAYRALRGGGIGDGGVGRSPGGFVTSGDSTDFYWSRGVAVRLLPGAGERYRMSLRFFAESDADLVTGGARASEGEVADADGIEGDARVRNRFGVSASWRPWWGGVTAQTLGGGGWAGVRGALGDNPHVRAGVTGALVVPLGGGYSAGMEAGGAWAWGDPARLDLWSLGADGRWLRGHSGNLLSSGILRARLDLQRPVSFLRLSVFADWASSGGIDYYAVGTGLVFMDGITRLDVAHGLRAGQEGRLTAALRVHTLGDGLF